MDTTTTIIQPEQHTAAKIVGVLYLAQMTLAIFAESFLRGRMIVHGDAAQTATNIAASAQMFRLSLVCDLIVYSTVVILIWALYVVLKPVNKNLALLAAFLRLVENAILSVTVMAAFAMLALLSGAEYLRAFNAEQLQALVSTSLRVYGAGFSIGFVFLGLGSTVFSYLWLKSGYIPRVLAGWGIFSSLVLALVTLVTLASPTVYAPWD
jgi:hypothetical protein